MSPAPRAAPRSLVRDSRLAFLAAVGTRPFDALRGLAVAAIVGPTAYGTWQLASLAWLWGGNLHLGTLNVLARELPGLLRQGSADAAAALRSRVATVCMATASAGALLVALYGLSTDTDPASWLLIAMVLPFHSTWLFRLEAARAERAFRDIAVIAVAGAVGLLSASVVFGWYAGIGGVLVATLLHRALSGLAYRVRSGWRAGLAAGGTAAVIARGLPYWTLVLLALVYASADRFLVAAWLDRAALGVYGLALAATAPLRAWTQAVDDAMQPRLLARHESDPLPARPLPHESLYLWCCGLAVLALPFVVRWFLPAYAGAADAIVVLGVAAWIPWASVGFGTRLLALDRSDDLRLAYGLAGAVTLSVSGALIAWGLGVTGAAVGMAAGEATRSSVLVRRVLRRDRVEGSSAARVVASLAAGPAAAVSCVTLAWLAGSFVDRWEVAAPWLLTATTCAVFSTLWPAVWKVAVAFRARLLTQSEVAQLARVRA